MQFQTVLRDLMTLRVNFFSLPLQLQIIWHMTLRSSRAFRRRAGATSIHGLCCLQAPYREGTRVIFMRLHVNLFNESSTSGFVGRGVAAFHPTWQNDLYQHWKMRPLLSCESVTVSVRCAVFVRPCRQKSVSYVITCLLRFGCGPGFCRVASAWFVQMDHVTRSVRLTMLKMPQIWGQMSPLQSCWKTA